MPTELLQDCHTVLQGLDFRETRLNYFVRGGIHVEVRLVCGHERWEITDYRWKNNRQLKTSLTGVGGNMLQYHLAVKIQEHTQRVGRP